MRSVLFFTSFVLIITLLAGFIPVNGESEIYENVIRLHILANSDSEKDQDMKLKIRDSVLCDMSEYMSKSASVNEAKQIIGSNIERIERVAGETAAKLGCDYDCSVVLGYEYYPTREYEGVSLPAGNYYSVRIMVGEARGHNWWCVLFPTLCLNAAKPREELAEVGFTPDEVNILCDNESPKYVFKFKLLEFFESCFCQSR